MSRPGRGEQQRALTLRGPSRLLLAGALVALLVASALLPKGRFGWLPGAAALALLGFSALVLPARRHAPLRRLPRPLRPALPVAGTVLTLLLWGVVAHDSGSGWIQSIGAVIAAALVVGLLGPLVALRGAEIHCVTCPTDAVSGVGFEVGLRATSRLRVTPRSPAGSPCFAGPAAHNTAEVTANGRCTLVAAHRGTLQEIEVLAATAAPFGLLWWARPVTVRLPRTVHVAPRLGAPLPAVRREHAGAGETAGRHSAPTGEPRGVRPYRAGDQRRSVHWPATAHAGHLMVKEAEAPTAGAALVTVVLPEASEAAEAVSESALGTVDALLGQGVAVELATTERGGTRSEAVTTTLGAGRRLARAVAPSAPPATTTAEVEVRWR